ncbi:unnamed protein product [Lactuca virosa]|uniref:Uncharacterized protein n=1 Tax=Lactuca virosa TaxID=75947 RepID=A0AAU9M422_9ASTR|nr:unnamed protein product [Lactuca virosa]
MATTIQLAFSTATEGRLSNVSDCTSSSSASDHDEYTPTNRGSVHQSRKWRKFMKKVVEGSKRSIYGSSKPMIFRYDAVSYSLNFDEGNHSDECNIYGSRCS